MSGSNDPEREFWGGDSIPRAAESRGTTRGQYKYLHQHVLTKLMYHGVFLHQEIQLRPGLSRGQTPVLQQGKVDATAAPGLGVYSNTIH